MFLPAAIAAAGGLAGSALDSYSQSSANDANRRSSREQMSFQERMSNTAYQRSVADMKSAGLNPALMYGSGGASSTPSGANSNNIGGNVGHHLTSSARSVALERATVASQVDLARSQAILNAANARLSYASAKRTEFDLPKHELHGTLYGGANSALQSVSNSSWSKEWNDDWKKSSGPFDFFKRRVWR